MPVRLIKPFDGIRELGLTELVGVDEQVDQNDYSGSVAIDISPAPTPASGVIQQWMFYQTEDGTGAILSPAGTLYVLDADPDVSSGDTSLTAAEWVTIVGEIDVEAGDWSADANGSIAVIKDQPLWFHSLSTLYFVFKLTSATSINSAAGDNEQLEFNGEMLLYS